MKEEQVVLLDIAALKPHPQNDYYFNDITREKHEAFCRSLQKGQIAPIIVTEDNVVVAGHQRMRRLRDIGQTQVAAIVRHFDSEDEIERALIDSNTS